MKIFNLVRSEFKKNYNIKKLLIIILFLIISVIAFVEMYKFDNDNNYYHGDLENSLANYKYELDNLQNKEKRTSLDEYEFFYYNNAVKEFQHLVEMNVKDNDFQCEVTERLLSAKYKNKVQNLHFKTE